MPGERARGWRGDIQALRALAVVAVVAFHLGMPGCDRGYLGVDVFFVISGYLIGARLEALAGNGHGREAGAQGLDLAHLAGFWRARVVRLWPAALVTLVFTAVPCAVLLDGREWRQFLWQVAGAAALCANWVLWQQTDYFGGGAGTKPLLHFWSLAVEEQFYLVAPLAFFLPRAHWRRLAIGVLTALSLALALYLAPRSPSATFYFLPTRGWELGLGVMLAQAGRAWPDSTRLLRPLAWAGLVVVLSGGTIIPEQVALLAATALAAIVLAGAVPVRQPPRWLTGIGDRSYAIYLVHWPIIAIAANVWMRGVPPGIRLVLLVPIALASEALWRLVDRRDRATRSSVVWLTLQTALLAVTLTSLWLVRPRAAEAFREPNEGFGAGCSPSGTFDLARACRSGDAGADVVVWGDSFAMQLVPGLAAMTHSGVVQATRVVCGPIVGLAPIGPGYSPQWAARCIAWNDSVLAAIVRDPTIRVVVLGSIFNQYVAGAMPGWKFALRRAGQVVTAPQDDHELAAALAGTIATLENAGKTVVLYRPQIYPDYDVGRCLSRRAQDLPTLGVAADCSFERSAAAPASRSVESFFDTLPRPAAPETISTGGPRVIDTRATLCPADHCLARSDGVPLFADAAHLSQDGSRWLLHTMNLGPVMAPRRNTPVSR